MGSLKVSLITVCFNSDKTIEDTFHSVLSQTYPNIEYIVIDGQSSDKTLEIIHQYSTLINTVVTEPDQGIYDAMNKGIRLATGDIIGFINADDVLANPNVIEHVVNTFKDYNIDACYADLYYVDYYDLDNIIRNWRSSEFSLGLFSKGWAPPHPTFYAKRSLYNRLGLFDLQYSMGNDIELMMRFMEKYRIKTRHVPEVWVKMRVGGVSNQSISHIVLQNMEIIRAAKNNSIPFSVVQFVFGKLIDRLKQYFF